MDLPLYIGHEALSADLGRFVSQLGCFLSPGASAPVEREEVQVVDAVLYLRAANVCQPSNDRTLCDCEARNRALNR